MSRGFALACTADKKAGLVAGFSGVAVDVA
jgi:hypothetical protein